MRLYASNATSSRSARHYARLNRPQEPLTMRSARPYPAKTATTPEPAKGGTSVTRVRRAEANVGGLFGNLFVSVAAILGRR